MFESASIGIAVGPRAAFEREPARRQAVNIERHRRRQRDGLDARRRAQRRQDARGELPVGRRVGAAAGQIVGRQQHAVGPEPGIGVAALLEALEEQAGDDEDEQRQRDLERPSASAEAGCARRAGSLRASACCGSSRAMNHAGAAAASTADSRPRPTANASPTRVDFGLKANRQRAGDLAALEAPASPRPPARCRADGARQRQQQRFDQDAGRRRAGARAPSARRMPNSR